jgi:hypothetical protein
LSVKVSVAVRGPKAPGENVTETEQLAPAETVAPHVLVRLKSVAYVPDSAMLTIFISADPVLETVTVFAGLVVPTGCFPNARPIELNAICGAPPVPVMGRACGEFGRLSTTISVAVRLPLPEGKKVIEIEQVAFAVSTDGQADVMLKSPPFVPPN